MDCSTLPNGADVANAKFPLADAARFRSWLEGAVSGRTVPPHRGVRHYSITVGSGPGGYVVTLIPQSDAAPHQVVGKMVYYMRAGSDFVPVPHGVLAGMFGRRPQPHVFHAYFVYPAAIAEEHICLQVGIVIRNNGPGIARDLFLNLFVNSIPGDNCTLEFQRAGSEDWTGNWLFNRNIALICPPGFRLPPEATVQPLVLNMGIAPPFSRDLEIQGMVGSGSSAPYRFRLFNTAENIQTLVEEILATHQAGQPVEELLKKFGFRLLQTESTRTENLAPQ